MHLLLIVLLLLLALTPQRSECRSRGFPHPLKVIRGFLELPGLVLGKTSEVCKNDGSGSGNNEAADGIISGVEGAEKGKGNNADGSSGNGDCCYSGLDVEEIVVQRSLKALEKQTARVGRALMITADTFAGVTGGALKTVGVTGATEMVVVKLRIACNGFVIHFFII